MRGAYCLIISESIKEDSKTGFMTMVDSKQQQTTEKIHLTGLRKNWQRCNRRVLVHECDAVVAICTFQALESKGVIGRDVAQLDWMGRIQQIEQKRE